MATTYYSYYYYDTTYPSYYYPTTEASASECLNYTYLVWVYFLYYIGAGYPSWYYPYIISTLLNYIPSECGGTGLGSGGATDSSLSLLSLFQNYNSFGSVGSGFPGLGFPQQQQQQGIVLYPGQTNVGYNSEGSYYSGSNSLSQYGIQQPAIVPYNKRSSGPEKKPSSRKKQQVKKKQKTSHNKPRRPSTNVKQTQPWRRIVTTTKPGHRKQVERTTIESSLKRKTASPQYRNSGKISKTSKSSKQFKEISKIQNRKRRRKQRRKFRRKQRRIRMRKIEKSVLSKIPKEKISEFKIKFNKGKVITRNVKNFKFLQNVQNPYSDQGTLRSDFRKIVQQKMIQKLPDYCEQTILEKLEKDKKRKDCANRAKRIKERIKKRLNG